MEVQKVVLLKFPRGLTHLEAEELLGLCRSLKSIPGVTTVVVGQDRAEGTQGFSYCFLVRFDSVDAYDNYGPHPAHIQLRNFVVAQPEHDVIGFNFQLQSGDEWRAQGR